MSVPTKKVAGQANHEIRGAVGGESLRQERTVQNTPAKKPYRPGPGVTVIGYAVPKKGVTPAGATTSSTTKPVAATTPNNNLPKETPAQYEAQHAAEKLAYEERKAKREARAEAKAAFEERQARRDERHNQQQEHNKRQWEQKCLVECLCVNCGYKGHGPSKCPEPPYMGLY